MIRHRNRAVLLVAVLVFLANNGNKGPGLNFVDSLKPSTSLKPILIRIKDYASTPDPSHLNIIRTERYFRTVHLDGEGGVIRNDSLYHVIFAREQRKSFIGFIPNGMEKWGMFSIPFDINFAFSNLSFSATDIRHQQFDNPLSTRLRFSLYKRFGVKFHSADNDSRAKLSYVRLAQYNQCPQGYNPSPDGCSDQSPVRPDRWPEPTYPATIELIFAVKFIIGCFFLGWNLKLCGSRDLSRELAAARWYRSWVFWSLALGFAFLFL